MFTGWKMVTWPCVFKLEGDSELVYLESESHLVSEFEGLIWDVSDCLIDSDGHCFLVREEDDGYAFEPKGGQLTLPEVVKLVQEHEFSKAECA
ncbi:DUF4144 family protein [Vibrio sp. ArtGut-C1]|uniref:DUF4144 family protein n=1 Tax=Vibrio sp. ArtGut-C1 TaxID=2259137 RepID=UPI00352A94C1